MTTETSRQYFRDQAAVRVSGYPTRPELQVWDRQDAFRALELREDLPVVFVFGGSKGARSINRALLAVLPGILPDAQVLHISGSLDWPEIEAASQALPAELAERYHPYPYLHEEMGAALSVADLVVSRAGASTLGEFPLFGIPAILVPYPYAWRYQRINAGVPGLPRCGFDCDGRRPGSATAADRQRIAERSKPASSNAPGHGQTGHTQSSQPDRQGINRSGGRPKCRRT